MGVRLENLIANSEEIRAIALRHKGLSISIFGSVARGDDGPNSDYDFLVEFAEGSSLLDCAALANDLTDYLGVQVDVISQGGLKSSDHKIRAEAILL